jgi:hypothetical protein
MMTIKTETFYANQNDVIFVTESRRVWIVSSPDFDGIREIKESDIPADCVNASDLLTADEAIDYMMQVEDESGEIIVDGYAESKKG